MELLGELEIPFAVKGSLIQYISYSPKGNIIAEVRWPSLYSKDLSTPRGPHFYETI